MSNTMATQTADELSDDQAKFLVEFVNNRIGVQLEGKKYLMESRLTPLCHELGLSDLSQLVAKVRSGDRDAQTRVLDSMTTNETSFFRDAHPFDTLASDVLPAIFESTRGRLQVWNGASSSGQESYTFAITMLEQFPQHATPTKLRILSTDVSTAMIERTIEAEYSKFEVNRGLPADQALKYFDQVGRKWVAKRELKALVQAKVLNLLDPWAGVPKSDLVLLRNVLCYFSPQVKQQILQRVRNEVIAPHGCLVLGASESILGLDCGFESRRIGASTFYFPV